jgi:hypothetical protein
VTFERVGWALVYFGGSLGLYFGVLPAFAIGSEGILIGLSLQAFSRVVIAIWSIVRPEAQLRYRPAAWRIAEAVIWSAIALILIIGEPR